MRFFGKRKSESPKVRLSRISTIAIYHLFTLLINLVNYFILKSWSYFQFPAGTMYFEEFSRLLAFNKYNVQAWRSVEEKVRLSCVEDVRNKNVTYLLAFPIQRHGIDYSFSTFHNN
jgi:hypothetical protein